MELLYGLLYGLLRIVTYCYMQKCDSRARRAFWRFVRKHSGAWHGSGLPNGHPDGRRDGRLHCCESSGRPYGRRVGHRVSRRDGRLTESFVQLTESSEELMDPRLKICSIEPNYIQSKRRPSQDKKNATPQSPPSPQSSMLRSTTEDRRLAQH